MDKGQYGRKDRLIQQKRIDAYEEKQKLPDPTQCEQCKAVFTGGRWTWNILPDISNKSICPACQRTNDNFPAGYIELSGTFLKHHKDEIHNLIKNIEENEKNQHPIERIMDIITEESKTTITTTGIHIARRIGEAVNKAYQGNLDFSYGDNEKIIRVKWNRD
jgi:hypothetical protein